MKSIWCDTCSIALCPKKSCVWKPIWLQKNLNICEKLILWYRAYGCVQPTKRIALKLSSGNKIFSLDICNNLDWVYYSCRKYALRQYSIYANNQMWIATFTLYVSVTFVYPKDTFLCTLIHKLGYLWYKSTVCHKRKPMRKGRHR